LTTSTFHITQKAKTLSKKGKTRIIKINLHVYLQVSKNVLQTFYVKGKWIPTLFKKEGVHSNCLNEKNT